MSKEKILVVEDDKHISRLVKYNVDKSGYNCLVAEDGDEALDILGRQNIDLIILDIMLPEIDGFEVCRTLKQDIKLKNIPIIMLTAKGEEVDRIVGLELGADDYVVKPFSPRELMLRVKAVLRRKKMPESPRDIITRGALVVDTAKHKVTVYNKDVELTPIEFKLLVTLLERAGRMQSRDQLLSDVWGMHSDVFTRTVDTHIKRLREKLGKMGKLIETIRGMGYRCKEDED
jgi:two-component system phosphate regulon response regulator PhoB